MEAPQSPDLSWRRTVERAGRAADGALQQPRLAPAGVAYQGLALGWTLGLGAALAVAARLKPSLGAAGAELSLPRAGAGLDALGLMDARVLVSAFSERRWSVPGALLALVALRLAPGLARAIASGERGDALGLGRGSGRSVAALWAQLVLTMFAASGLVLGAALLALEVVGEDASAALGKVAVGLALTFLVVYGATLGALYHLALASLVRHRRGAGSALLHAWRLVRAQPAAAARAIFVEGAAVLALGALAVAIDVGWVLTIALMAVIGGARARFWAASYTAFGGVEPVGETDGA